MSTHSNLIPVCLTIIGGDDDGSPATGLTFAPGELLVSQDDDAPANAAGTMTEVAGDVQGIYVYAATAGEMGCDQIALIVSKSGVSTYAYAQRVPFDTEMTSGETNPLARRVPIFLADSVTGEPRAGLGPGEDGGVYLSVNAGAWTVLDSDGWLEAGGDGAGNGYYNQQLIANDYSEGLVMLFVHFAGTLPYLYSFYASAASGGGVSPPTPVPVVITPDAPAYVDYTAIALSRLAEQFKSHDEDL